ncbi:Nitrate transporter 1.5 [Platanthera zijinensis]|uniref:Nitrate transporter 1.5 n=1 Tax=Platanthera zijinensis TaxID=2320716 RepID=A0AAP0G2D4_9ASPA
MRWSYDKGGSARGESGGGSASVTSGLGAALQGGRTAEATAWTSCPSLPASSSSVLFELHFLQAEPELLLRSSMEVNEERARGREAADEEMAAMEANESCTLDGSVDFRGRPARRASTGGWPAGSLILVNQGLATLAFFGVGVNLVIFLTRVLHQNNAAAANNVSKWTGTVYLFSLIGAFLSDSYWGRYKTCAVFQIIFVTGLVMLSLTSYLFLLKPSGCGNEHASCEPHSGPKVILFYLSVYLVALGNGGYQPNIATFGADQFDEHHPTEAHSKISFFSYFYLFLNLGSLFSNTFLVYLEDDGSWALGFWVSAASALAAVALFFGGTRRYRRFRPNGNPLSRVCQVIVAAARKWDIDAPSSSKELYEAGSKEPADNGSRKLLHTEGFGFLDKAATFEGGDRTVPRRPCPPAGRDPWRLCTVTQVEEVKCVLRLLPIWLCTIIYSVVFTQMASLFVEQGAAMATSVASFHIPPASMSAFDILSVASFIFLYRRLLHPLARRVKADPRGLTELQRMGVGLVIAVAAMVAAGTVEIHRLKLAGSMSIMWQIPQYVLIGASEVFMYVGQLEFFNSQTPDGLKSFGSALCMLSMSLGNYVSSILVTVLTSITGGGGRRPGWIPDDLNRGHLDRFYFLLAGLTAADLVLYIICARRYKSIKLEGKGVEAGDEIAGAGDSFPAGNSAV